MTFSRKRDESFMIGDNIEVFVVRIKGNAVQIGVRAPKELRILRKELIGRLDGRKSA